MYFASLAHDLRTPINSVMTTLKFCKELAQSNDRFNNLLKLSTNSCEFLLSLIDDILDLSKIELNSFELNKQHFNLRDCVSQTLDTLQP